MKIRVNSSVRKNTAFLICPECGNIMIPESGCLYCRVCGFTSCLV